MTDAEPGGGNDGQRDLELIARWKSGDERAATELGIDVLGRATFDQRIDPLPPLLLPFACSGRLFGSGCTDDQEMHIDS